MININDLKGLHDLGFAIHLLHPNSKRPMGLEWSKGARKSFAELREALKANPKANVGVRVGSVSKFKDGTQLVIVDVDSKSDLPEHISELNAALRKMQLPQGAFVKSGRGGESKHFYLRSVGDFAGYKYAQSKHLVKVKMPSVNVNSKRELEILTKSEIKEGIKMRPAWEIEIYSTGKQVVLPPSVHPDTGQNYIWGRTINSLKDVPVFEFKKPEKQLDKAPLLKDPVKAFKRAEVELLDLVLDNRLGQEIVDLIESGDCSKYDGDRSSGIYASICSLVNAKLSDNEIASIMTDPLHGISEKAWEKGNEAQAAKWILDQVRKVRHANSPGKAFDVEASDVELTGEELISDQEKEVMSLESKLLKSQNGSIKNCSANLEMIFQSLGEGKIFTFCLFSYRVLFAKDPPWNNSHDSWIGREVSDSDLTKIQIYITSVWHFEPGLGAIQGVVKMMAEDNAHHPVRDYLKSLTWDGQPRLNYLFEDYLIGENNKSYMEAAASTTLIAAVKRIFEPGCKFDTVLIIEGEQGSYKSTALNILAGNWFSDSLGDITSKDVINNLQKCWIIEIGELSSFTKVEVNALKDFITRKVDRARLAFERTAKDYPRQCIFIGTTNSYEYLRDESGNRRFNPVKVGKIDIEKLKNDRDQIWAEAYARYLKGEETYFADDDVKQAAKTEQAARLIHDEWGTEISEWVVRNDKKEITLKEIWSEVFNHSDASKFDSWTQKRISTCLRTLGYKPMQLWRDGTKTRKWVVK